VLFSPPDTMIIIVIMTGSGVASHSTTTITPAYHGIPCSGTPRHYHRPRTTSGRTLLLARDEALAKTGQQCYFRELVFTREREVFLWYTNIPQDPNAIPSYAEDVEFQTIHFWRDPTLFSRVLKCFSHVKTLTIFETGVTRDELCNVASSGGFGRELTSLVLLSPFCTLPTLMLLVLSFPDLKESVIRGMTEAPSVIPTPPDTIWQGAPLELLELSWVGSKGVRSIARCGITSRRIVLGVGDAAIEKILANSSQTVVELVLRGAW
jgi:hypothetical protein